MEEGKTWEFKGISMTKNEDTGAIVVKLAKLLNMVISKTDISVYHRLPPSLSNVILLKPDQPTSNAHFIIIKVAKNMKAENFSAHGMNKLFVNENLNIGKSFCGLQSRELLSKILNISGLIMEKYFVRKSDDSNIFHINSECNLCQFDD